MSIIYVISKDRHFGKNLESLKELRQKLLFIHNYYIARKISFLVELHGVDPFYLNK